MRSDGAHVLVTGGTGSIGSEVVRQLMDRNPKHITIFSRDDSKHFYFQQELVGRDDITFSIGDVRDREALARAFQTDVDIVIHAAALKHVEIGEYNPFEVVKTNVIGAQNVVEACMRNNVKKVIALSTD